MNQMLKAVLEVKLYSHRTIFGDELDGPGLYLSGASPIPIGNIVTPNVDTPPIIERFAVSTNPSGPDATADMGARLRDEVIVPLARAALVQPIPAIQTSDPCTDDSDVDLDVRLRRCVTLGFGQSPIPLVPMSRRGYIVLGFSSVTTQRPVAVSARCSNRKSVNVAEKAINASARHGGSLPARHWRVKGYAAPSPSAERSGRAVSTIRGWDEWTSILPRVRSDARMG